MSPQGTSVSSLPSLPYVRSSLSSLLAAHCTRSARRVPCADDTAGIAQLPARENARKRDAMTTPFPPLFLQDARVHENEAFSATNRGKGWENIQFHCHIPNYVSEVPALRRTHPPVSAYACACTVHVDHIALRRVRLRVAVSIPAHASLIPCRSPCTVCVCAVYHVPNCTGTHAYTHARQQSSPPSIAGVTATSRYLRTGPFRAPSGCEYAIGCLNMTLKITTRMRTKTTPKTSTRTEDRGQLRKRGNTMHCSLLSSHTRTLHPCTPHTAPRTAYHASPIPHPHPAIASHNVEWGASADSPPGLIPIEQCRSVSL